MIAWLAVPAVEIVSILALSTLSRSCARDAPQHAVFIFDTHVTEGVVITRAAYSQHPYEANNQSREGHFIFMHTFYVFDGIGFMACRIMELCLSVV